MKDRLFRMLIPAIIIFYIIIALLAYLPIEQWVGDGRGDWEKELCNGYAITKINSHQIVLTYHGDDRFSSSILLDNYFITGYQNHDPYILVKGIPTQGHTLSENDLESSDILYYFVDTIEHSIDGPYKSSEEFRAYCYARSIAVSENWEKTVIGFRETENALNGLRVQTVDP